MLLLFDASLIVFFKFLQVFLWISIPALLIGMLITTVIHYNNKRKKSKSLDEPFIFEGEGSYAGYDDVSLMPLNLFLHGFACCKSLLECYSNQQCLLFNKFDLAIHRNKSVYVGGKLVCVLGTLYKSTSV